MKETRGAKAHPQIVEYFSVLKDAYQFNSDEVSWCSAFVNWCMYQANKTMTRSPVARSWMAVGAQSEKPQPGDIAVFYKRNSTWQGHVGFFICYNHRRNAILVLGGNQSDQVCYKWYRVNGKRLYLHSFRRV